MMSVLPPKVAVIVPYFQRQAGLLRACAESVLAQQGAFHLQLVVVDDQSPHPARQELAGLHDDRVRLIEQDNAGPGAARNRGLDALESDTDFVAFLDSDDVWTQGHLARLLTLFQAGCDMAFANSVRYNQSGTRFDWGSGLDGLLSNGTQSFGTESFSVDAKHFYDFAIRRSGVISTSTLAYRRAAMPQLRFATQLFNGQDRYFKLQCALAAQRVGVCRQVGATEGQGENIFDSAGWGSEKSLRFLRNYLRLPKLILATLPLDAPQRRFVKGQLHDARQSLWRTTLHLLWNRKRMDWRMLAGAVREDPAALLQLPVIVLSVLRSRLGPTQGNT